MDGATRTAAGLLAFFPSPPDDPAGLLPTCADLTEGAVLVPLDANLRREIHAGGPVLPTTGTPDERSPRDRGWNERQGSCWMAPRGVFSFHEPFNLSRTFQSVGGRLRFRATRCPHIHALPIYADTRSVYAIKLSAHAFVARWSPAPSACRPQPESKIRLPSVHRRRRGRRRPTRCRLVCRLGRAACSAPSAS